jgi:hypothetical protein
MTEQPLQQVDLIEPVHRDISLFFVPFPVPLFVAALFCR